MNLKLTFVTHLLIGISLPVMKVEALKCYVCEDGGDQPCKDFDLKKDMYAKECLPPNDRGCEKQTQSDRVNRTCSNREFNECEIANGVEYCFCFTDLCNSNISKFVGLTDDEDILEGSGTRISPTEKPIVRKDKSSSDKPDLYCSLAFIPFITMFYNK